MAKARCPHCKHYMFTDFNSNITWCMWCDYRKPSDNDIMWGKITKRYDHED
jgi:primosomal protein N'